MISHLRLRLFNRYLAILELMVARKHIIRIGRSVRHVSRLRGGSGSALPGLVIEKLDPQFSKDILEELPYGVVVISGTNGKTTTTKMVAQLLRDQGLKVFTNKTGSNFTRGIVAALLTEVDNSGRLNADIAVLELDEAYAAHFVRSIRPRYSLLLNVMRDQLDRFGEIDHTAKLLQTVAEATTDGIVLNRNDPLVSAIADHLPSSVKVEYFGLNPRLLSLFPSDQNLHTSTANQPNLSAKTNQNDVTLESFDDHTAVFSFAGEKQSPTTLKIDGIYNIQNAAAAMTMVRMICGNKTDNKTLLDSASKAKPAFGRGEAIAINGYPLEIILVKNPAGFRLALSSYTHKPALTMIAINDNYADGRDMSWLWDIDFTDFKRVEIITGIRAYDMALRLQYDEVEVGDVDTNIAHALNSLLTLPAEPKRIFCTYTAMMHIRKLLAKNYAIEDIDS